MIDKTKELQKMMKTRKNKILLYKQSTKKNGNSFVDKIL